MTQALVYMNLINWKNTIPHICSDYKRDLKKILKQPQVQAFINPFRRFQYPKEDRCISHLILKLSDNQYFCHLKIILVQEVIKILQTISSSTRMVLLLLLMCVKDLLKKYQKSKRILALELILDNRRQSQSKGLIQYSNRLLKGSGTMSHVFIKLI